MNSQQLDELEMNLEWAKMKLEKGDVNHWHIYRMYVNDVETLMEEILALRDMLHKQETEVVT